MIIEPLAYKSLSLSPVVSGYLENNTYILYDSRTNDCVIIDPSLHFNEILAELTGKGIRPREIWLTHGHFDHYIGLGYPEALEAAVPVHIHPADVPLYSSGGDSFQASNHLLDNCPPPIPDLADGDSLFVGEYEFQVLHTPGHSPGHCCFYCAEAGWLFSGDLLFFHSYGRTDLSGGDEAALFDSLKNKAFTLPEDTIILPGHNDYTQIGSEVKFFHDYGIL